MFEEQARKRKGELERKWEYKRKLPELQTKMFLNGRRYSCALHHCRMVNVQICRDGNCYKFVDIEPMLSKLKTLCDKLGKDEVLRLLGYNDTNNNMTTTTATTTTVLR
jgi:hypothetical protein